ncbi:hypothetical protein SAY86_002071 [Trapa natans]|uniref:Peptidase A1 domain-containing protein n=1 Tax=Trapa natans TaxID=22666 RepID=A0AAN7LF01_TRANT|nr:hypothetical protein SAY86_002071 [Trapa natans]
MAPIKPISPLTPSPLSTMSTLQPLIISLLTCHLLLSGLPSSMAASGHGPQCSGPERGSTLRIFHVNSPCSPLRPPAGLSWEESVLRMQAEDQARLQFLSSLAGSRKKSSIPVASGRQIVQSPTYVARVQIGTPEQTMLMALDTSNDAAWVPCSGCIGCAPSTVFDPTRSTSFKTVGCQATQCQQVPNPMCNGSACSFNMTYGGSSIAAGLSQDKFRLATNPVADYTFGCIQKATGTSVPPQGLLGLGRGPLSLVSQAQSMYKSTFSYCLPSFKSLNFSGSLRLGPAGQPVRIKYTPLLRNPRRSSLYYVNLIGIRVGRKVVDIPPEALAFNPATGAGTVFDSGTVFTRLVEPAYVAVRDAFRARMRNAAVSSLGGFDTCYTVPVVAPTITLMFAGVNMTLPMDNILIHSTAGGLTCLAMAAAPSNVNSVLNVIASMQQQNHRVLFDVPNSRLGVSREPCS